MRNGGHKEYRIPTNFKMPWGYSKRFLLITNTGKMEIEARPPRSLKVTITQTGPNEPAEESRALDWIQESVERIRYEVEDGLREASA